MLVWSGVGLLGIIVPGGGGVGGYFLLRGFGLGAAGIGVGIILGSLLTWWLARKINEQEGEGAAGGLFYIPLEIWSVVSGLIGAFVLVRGVVFVLLG